MWGRGCRLRVCCGSPHTLRGYVRGLGLRVQHLGLRFWGFEFRVSCFELRLPVQTAGGNGEDVGFRVLCSVFEAESFESVFRVWD